MNAAFFDLKRAFHASLNITRPMLARAGLTPARFDMLYALYKEDPDSGFDPDGEDAFQAQLAEERLIDELAAGNVPDLPVTHEELATARAPLPPNDLPPNDLPPNDLSPDGLPHEGLPHDGPSPDDTLVDAQPFRRTARPRSVRQSELVQLLGVSRMTVSRMVRALEDLGLVLRRPVRPGARRLFVELTTRGLERLRELLHDLVDGGAIDLATDSILEPDAWFDPARVLATREKLQHLLRRIRYGGGDRATLRYLWHPED